MLPAPHRLRHSREFTAVTRSGRRVRRGVLVVHRLHDPAGTGPARAGFVVSRAVGNSVVRHRVTRRLRALLTPHLVALPAGTAIVVRALPGAATADSAVLGRDLEAALQPAGGRVPA